MKSETYCYDNSFDVAVIDITGERRKALLDAVEGTMNDCYGEKRFYYWERIPYEAVIEKINSLSDTAETVMLLGGFYEITKFSLKRYASKNTICNEMIRELEEAESEPEDAEDEFGNLKF